jgi:putative ABC transport system permease protein
MRFFPLVLKNIFRNRRRTLLTAAGIAVAVFVISALLAVETGFAALIGSADDTLLNVREKGLACPVTSRVFDSYLSNIAGTPGVRSATGVLRGLYTYRRKENLVVVSGVDYEEFRKLKSVHVVSGSERAFLARSDAALVGAPMAAQHDWKAGQLVSFVEGLTVTVAGTFVSADKSYDAGVLTHKSYLSRLQRDEGKSTYLVVALNDPGMVSSVSQAIDTELANFPKPTKTQSERASRERELQDFLEIRRMLGLMVAAAVLVSIFGAANSVSMSVRERLREVGILRSLGLNKGQILSILMGESVAISIVGGAVGIGLSALLLATDRTMGGMIPLGLRASALAVAAGASLLIGLTGALLPALRAARVPIVETLQLAD